MTRYALRTAATGVLIIFGAATLVFFIMRIAPGDQALVLLGPDATAAEVGAARARLGLDQPLWVQYWHYLGQLATLDFGESYRFGQPAFELVLSRLPASVELTLAATVIAMSGVVLGALAGAYRGRWIDRGISGFALTLYSMPPFWIGIMLILVMALQLRLLPSAGTGTPAHIVLPALTLAAPFTALLTRITRSSVADTMAEPYVRRAYAKGFSKREVVTGHVVRNAATPVVTVGALHVSTLLGGAVIVESVFTWPGLGSLLVTAVANRDYSIVQAAVLLIAVIVVCCNVAADLIAARLDPRVRLGAGA
ncbi:ABC transporter permease [Nonomuraea sp. K274]|uniref:ABC transporter permease n=1 Tax=Nonomuraea cypriaca TaxID=1187855 RepID=A0A931AAF5_9ACTN|nr:ABC transporter permease [Nonomuraea cypriaca]MBF8189251.1 ABC transporter permease [Nonomuraea cypriaca]